MLCEDNVLNRMVVPSLLACDYGVLIRQYEDILGQEMAGGGI